ncbi:GNAT family N-acetyltransferase [Dokdonella sp.]|uniref:GNAT family N-acetyltransferase n=1 Tax=Dokdonella sp. TaxID=2291710 RepID=UPI002CC8FA4B|nr:GNAT family N-acetyltransferase [Dokdonella sp.]HOX72847.1 GNAT family N-acetyltransferase [Dokdonella sp.]HPN79405.1 GNAT family N-acetyltransferase [Dokdonella sp.]
MPLPITIRAATDADLDFLVESNAALALETERKVLDREVLARGAKAVFAEPHRGRYKIAERDGAPVGCLLVTFEWSDWRNGDWWWIQSVYVTRDARRSGVFSALYADVERQARSTAGVVGLRLYVENANDDAQATYAALGMGDSGYRLLETAFVDFF